MNLFVKQRFVRAVGAVALAATGLCHAESGSWPEFRGPTKDGHAEGNLPLVWSETQNVRWKTATPLSGWSTPVVAGGQVWFTAADEEGHAFHAVCVDAESGAIVYNERLFECAAPDPLGNEVNGYASPSPVVEPGRVYVHFGSYGTACIDTANFSTVWRRWDLPCRHYRGPGSSLLLDGTQLILTFDGADYQYVTALDTKTGASLWRTDRSTKWTDLDENGQPQREGDFRKGFSTPLIIDGPAGRQLISVGSMAAFAYEPATGKEIWTLRMPGHTPAPRPVYGNGLVYLSNGRGKAEFYAVRVNGTGDVTDTHVAWKAEGGFLPQEPSPLLADGLLYLVSNTGAVTCVEAETGVQVWTQRIGGNYVTSPILNRGHLYFSSTQGKTTVLKAGRAFETVSVNALDDGFMASPAAAGNALFLRTKSHLYRIEEASASQP